MNRKSLSLMGALIITLLLSVCSDKPTSPMNNAPNNNEQQNNGTAIAKTEVFTVNGTFSKNDNECYFVTAANSSQTELNFTTVRPPNFQNGSLITVTGPLFDGPDNRCGFPGPIILVQSIRAQNAGGTNNIPPPVEQQ
jgi:hypothetical protein